MAVPKRKLSRSRTRHRRAQWLKTAPATNATCPRCKAPTRPHTVCAQCGTYRGREVVEPAS
jgi:large subunit ribosomal protein L32